MRMQNLTVATLSGVLLCICQSSQTQAQDLITSSMTRGADIEVLPTDQLHLREIVGDRTVRFGDVVLDGRENKVSFALGPIEDVIDIDTTVDFDTGEGSLTVSLAVAKIGIAHVGNRHFILIGFGPIQLELGYEPGFSAITGSTARIPPPSPYRVIVSDGEQYRVVAEGVAGDSYLRRHAAPVNWRDNWTVVLLDDFDDNDISDWSYIEPGGKLRPEPNVLNGVVSGVGEGYHEPGLHATMSRAGTFDAQDAIEVELRSVAGPSWPNSTQVFLVGSGWGTSEWGGYVLNVYGESNRRFEIWRHHQGRGEALGQYPLGAAVHDWHTYKVVRDSRGNWTLFIDGAEQTDAHFNADMTFTRFDHTSLFFHRNQSKCDWISIKTAR